MFKNYGICQDHKVKLSPGLKIFARDYGPWMFQIVRFLKSSKTKDHKEEENLENHKSLCDLQFVD
jgi:hypothetical protein